MGELEEVGNGETEEVEKETDERNEKRKEELREDPSGLEEAVGRSVGVDEFSELGLLFGEVDRGDVENEGVEGVHERIEA